MKTIPQILSLIQHLTKLGCYELADNLYLTNFKC